MNRQAGSNEQTEGSNAIQYRKKRMIQWTLKEGSSAITMTSQGDPMSRQEGSNAAAMANREDPMNGQEGSNATVVNSRRIQ